MYDLIWCPTGSVLGPPLSIIYMNDIHNSSAKFSFYLFARICCILTLIWNLLKNRQLSELLKVFDWLNANKLTLNAKKSNYVIFRPYQCNFNYSVNIVLIDKCTQITTTPHCKDLAKCLGVLLDSIYLSWKFHINNVALKVNRTVELLPVFGTSSHVQSF